MARPREFDTDEALDKAMLLFWHHGYERSSLSNLLDAMGIQRSSFYNSFGDKRQLFLRALNRYMKSVNEDWIIKVLDEGDNGISGINQVFDAYINAFSEDKDCKGCLIVNTMVELAPHDEEIARLLNRELQTVEDAFVRALRRARDASLIPTNLDLHSTASFLMTTLHGMRVLARQTAERESFEAVVDTALLVLDT